MSDLLEQPAPQSTKEGKARAKAEKAYAKASRPWYKKPLFVILGIVALAMFGGALSGDGSETSPVAVPDATTDGQGAGDVAAEPAEANAQAEAEPAQESLPGIGDAVEDGAFTFTVHSVKCGKESVGSAYLEEKAQGQFCLINVTVANHGDEAQLLFSDNQYVFDGKGRKFSHDDVAAISIEGNESVWMEEINPGNSVKGTMVFDVPKKAKIVRAELHDSAFSGGVTISLR